MKSEESKNKAKEIKAQYLKAATDADFVWERVKHGVTEPEAILYRNCTDAIAFRNSIILIQGKAGTHKSRIASHFASLLIGEGGDQQMIGLSRNGEKEFVVLYVDTERNLQSQLPGAMIQILKDAQLDEKEHPFALTAVPLVNVNRLSRFGVLTKYIEDLKNHEFRDGKHIVVILDVITDCLSDFNSLVESYNLIDMMNSTINKEDVTFICIIHENPGTEKARGHIGTELGNKASTTFQVAETNQRGVFCIKILKSRSTGRGNQIYVRFDPEVNNLVLIDNEQEIFGLMDRKGEEILLALGRKVVTEIDKPSLFKYLKQEINLSDRSLQSKLEHVINSKLSVETILGTGHIEKVKGKPIRYKMIYDDPAMNVAD
jgi:KaiC/GvpD/RAD55 family RecA-like ATPase